MTLLGAFLSAFLVQAIGYVACTTIFKGKGDRYYDMFGSFGFVI